MVKLPWLHCLCNYSYTEYVTKVKDLTYCDIFKSRRRFPHAKSYQSDIIHVIVTISYDNNLIDDVNPSQLGEAQWCIPPI